MSDTTEDTGVEFEPDAALSPEDALSDMQARLQETEAAAARERQARIDAEARASEAGRAVQGAHTVAIDNALAAEEARAESAERDYVAAREAGDIAAEIKAQRTMSSATARVERLREQKEQATRQRQQEPRQQPAGSVPGAAAQRWLAEHPKSATDPIYQAALDVVHRAAVSAGYTVESPEYFAFAERELTARFGANHGRNEVPNHNNRDTNAPNQPRRTASGTAPGPTRAGSSARSASGADPAAIARRIGNGVTADDVVSIAEATYPRLEKAAAIKKYCEAQAAILEERGSDPVNHVEGRTYRI